ncbi:MAG: cobalt transporter CbiM [Deltaproteobacteria bacterium]|nr:cobalt transporter CbiM [Deltaproteobacteria bacterium]
MHISEGVLSPQLLAGGAVLASAGLAIGMRQLKAEKIPQVAVLSSAFFVGSLIHVPAGPVSVHLVLNGINGLILGWAAFPSIFVALTLQALLFQFGGLTVLGVNTVVMAFPAVLSYYVFGRLVRRGSKLTAWAGGFGAGFVSVAVGACLVGLSLALTGKNFYQAAMVAVAAHIPVMIIEGIITGFCVTFLRRVRPEILGIKAESREEDRR